MSSTEWAEWSQQRLYELSTEGYIGSALEATWAQQKMLRGLSREGYMGSAKKATCAQQRRLHELNRECSRGNCVSRDYMDSGGIALKHGLYWLRMW